MGSVKWQNYGYSLTGSSFLVSFLCKADKTKSEKRKELFRNEFHSYGVKLEEDVHSVHWRLVCPVVLSLFLSFEKFRSWLRGSLEVKGVVKSR